MALAPEDATTVPDGMNVPLETRPHLYVCVSCRRRGAEPVAESQVYAGSPDFYKTRLDWIANAKPADVQEVAKRWMSDGVFVLNVEPVAEGEQTDGRRLYEAVKSLADEMGKDAPAQVVPTLCFANCERGCSVGLSAAGKWSYLVGEVGPEHASDLLTYATAYAKAKTGVVLPSGRPASLQTSVIARFPAPFEPAKDAAE